MKTLNSAGKTCILILFSLQINAQVEQINLLEQRASSEPRPSVYRYAHVGAISGAIGTTVGNAIGGRNLGIATGTLASIASNLLVRSRTDGHTALLTTGAGMVVTAGLTIGLNRKKRKSTDCFKF